MYALDGEWQRRYPEMVGKLACRRCAVVRHTWKCQDTGGHYVDDHTAVANQSVSHDLDQWDHIEEEGSRAAMIMRHPRPALLQGAEERVRATARLTRGDQEAIANAREALREWSQ